MAGDTDMRSWADLLHSSSQLLHSSTPSAHFPSIQRNLDQLETLSRQLKAKTSRFETPGETIAATRLLAREGINADQLTRDLKSFELKTTFEDVFPVEATSVEEYLQQVHEMAMLSAIQQAQRDNLRNFDDYMMKAIEDDWQREKREFLNNLSRLPFAPAARTAGSPVGSMPQIGWQMSPAPVSRLGQEGRGQEIVQQTLLDRKTVAYAEATSRLNAARERSLPFKAASGFKAAYESVAGEVSSSKSINIGKIWNLLQSLLGEDVEPLPNLSRKIRMVVGARRHLEAGHEKHVFDTIQSHAAQAALGGSTGNLQRIRAFLRVRLRDHGPLDFDATDMRRQPAMDTTWHQIYYCLRTGYYDEASHVATSSRVSRSFAPQLAEWISNGGLVSAATAAAASEECERMYRTGDRVGRVGYDKKKMLLHAIVSGSRQQCDRLLRDIPVLFSTIEDFLWFKLAMIREKDGSSDGQGGLTGLIPYTLKDLQSYLTKFEPSYYTKNGKDPLVYPYILLLSLQLQNAVAYLSKEVGAEGYHVDAVHIAIAIADNGVLSEDASIARNAGALDAVGEVASMIRQYGVSFVRQGNLVVALEYYAQAAAAMGGGASGWSGQSSSEHHRQMQMMFKQLLTELLLREGGIALLLGSAGMGSEGALRRFIPTQQGQHSLLLDAARQCQESGHYEKAIEMLKRVGAFAMALEIVNQRLSEAIAAIANGRSDGESKTTALFLAGNDILDTHKNVGAGSSHEREQVVEQQTAFRQLESILAFHKLERAGRYSEALRELSRLSFLPLDSRTPERSAEALRNTSATVQACVPDLLKVAITCLDNVTDTDGSVRSLKSKIASFVANSLPRNWPHDLYERVARML